METQILVINCGTSSIRASLFSRSTPQKRLWDRHLKEVDSYQEAMISLFEQLKKDRVSLQSISKVGHRIVQGGKKFTKNTVVTKTVFQELQELSSLAPLHNPPALKGIAVAKEMLPETTLQIAVFDTAFHSHFPPHIALYPLPLKLAEEHQIKRYGFHGISHAYLARKYSEVSPNNGKIITLHLGSGCSLAAIHNGKSIDTTMGFTPLEGLMMSTRSGSIDPAIVAFLAEQEKKSPEEVLFMLNHQSGLLGVSGTTGDMQILLSLKEKDERAKLAIEMFLYNLLKGVGAFVAVLGGVDALVFSGGIGENAHWIRSQLLKRLSWLGITVDELKNEQSVALTFGEVRKISKETSSVSVFVIATDENQLIAEEIL